MPEILQTTLAFIVAIAALIAIHEYGHFIVARKLGVKVEKFSIGFGPALFSWPSRDGEVTYVIAAIPLGGYVKMFGENASDLSAQKHLISEKDHKRAFDAQPVWVRAAIAAAGPAFNFMFAIVAYMIIAWVGQDVVPPVVGEVYQASRAQSVGIRPGDRVLRIDDRTVHSWQEMEETLKQAVGHTVMVEVRRGDARQRLRLTVPQAEQDPMMVNVADELVGISPDVRLVVDTVMPDMPAANAGLHGGDVIREVEGLPVNNIRKFIHIIQSHNGDPVSIGVQRDNTMLRFSVAPKEDDKGHVRIGVRLSTQANYELETYRMGMVSGLVYGFARTWDMTVMTLQVIGKMISSSISAENLGGPIAIAQLAGKTAQLGMISFLSFLALISVNLAVLNLLPVPVLDGGHLLYLAIERIRGKPLSTSVMEWTQAIGVFMIAALMIFAFYNDLARLFRG